MSVPSAGLRGTSPTQEVPIATDQPAVDLWTTRDRPVLEALVRHADELNDLVHWSQLAQELDRDPEEVKRAFASLERQRLIRLDGKSFGDRIGCMRDVAGEAYLRVGLYPDGDEAISHLISALRQAADRVDDPEEKSRLRRLADNAGGVSRDVLAAVLATVITGGLAS